MLFKCRVPCIPLKVARVMKLVFILWLSALLQVNAAGYAQRISFSLKNASLERTFKEIQKQTEYNFLYNTQMLRLASPVNISVSNSSIEEVLALCFKDQPLTYMINDNTVIVRRKAATPEADQLTRFIMKAIPVSGRVTSATGEPLISVSVRLKGTTTGTSTDANGNYTINVPDEGGILVFTYIGFITQEIPTSGRSVVNVTLAEDAMALGEVVITALGIEKSSKSLTYATQNISSEEITRVKDPNFMNSLAGKASGVVITKGNAGPGASTRVLLRGNKSITGNNQPLYVIDGIPMNNSANGSGNSLFSAQDFGDAISNLNQEDIENIEILKGASAAALYGSQAANGVILVTTKKGRRGTAKIDFTSSTTLENHIGLPENQTTYGQRVPGVTNESWGDAITNGSDSHIRDFFNTGKNYLNSLSISTGNDMGQLYISYANTRANGTVIENDLTKHNISVRGTSQLFNNKLSLDASMNYISQMVHNRPQSGYYLSPIFSLYLFPTGDDFSRYSGGNFETWDPVRLLYKQNWPYIVNEASSNQNPYWIQHRNQNDMFRERSISTFSAKYLINDWLNLQARVTYDRVEDTYEQRLYATTDPVQAHANGAYTKSTDNTNQLYSDLLLSGSKVFNNFTLSSTLGASFTQNKTYGMGLSSNSSSGLAYANYFSIYSLKFPFNSSESLRRAESQAVFGTATLGYKDRVFFDITGRNEWSSTIPQTFFYPSLGLSYILSDGSNTGPLSFAKFRGSYSEVGNALPFGVANRNPNYSLSFDDNINPRGTLPYFSGTDTIDLKPERTRSYEFGTEMRFFDDKLSLNLTYYNATTDEQVFTIAAPAGSGANNFYINGGTIRNKGVEGTLSYNTRMGAFSWTPSLNFSRNINQVVQLSDLLTTPRFVLTDINSTRQVQLFLTRPVDGKYGSYGDLYGKKIQYNDDGTTKVDANGLPVLSTNPDEYIGNANPDFLAGLNNRFSYKRASLSFLIDGRFGGKIVSVTETWRDWKGLSKRTAEARDAGGVMVNGNLVSAEAYYKRVSGSGQQGATELYTFDATNVRLREVALGFTVPSLGKAIKDLNISLVGRNLFFFYKDAPFDPEVSIAPSNGLQGIEGFQLPATRTYGLSVRASF